ncbi:MAG: hypothetical protein SFU53_13435 [Terrimicrobiaceae bacterium]|nr:hypothetical protein [Terrimicrobiaceae bacterium]
MLKVLPVLGLALALGGCSTLGPHQPFSFRKRTPGGGEPSVLTYSYVRSTASSSSDREYFKDAYRNASGSSQAEIRNRILFELMAMIDDHYYKYTVILRGDNIGKNLFTELAGIGTTFAASLAGGEQIKTVLAAISTGIQTFNTAVDKEVFLNQTMQAIRFQMDANRQKVATEMLNKMGGSTSGYPLEAGLRDIIRYYDAGTVTSALSSMSAQAAEQKTQAAAAAEKQAAILAGQTPRF